MPVAAVMGVVAIAGAVSQRNSARSAQRSQERAIAEGRSAVETATSRARSDVNRLFGLAQEQQAAGFGGAQALFGQSLPQQADIFQAGNVAAQQQLISGLPQFQSAILGGPIDFSAFQPTQLQGPDFSIFESQAPIAPPEQVFIGPGGTILPVGGIPRFGGRGRGGGGGRRTPFDDSVLTGQQTPLGTIGATQFAPPPTIPGFDFNLGTP